MRWVLSCLFFSVLLLGCTTSQVPGGGVAAWNVSLTSSETSELLNMLQKELKARFLSGHVDTQQGKWTERGHADRQLDLAQLAIIYKSTPVSERASAVDQFVAQKLPSPAVAPGTVANIMKTTSDSLGSK